MAEKLIRSKKQVKEYAEVFTPSHIVKKMVDLVDEQLGTEDYAFKTWFDPACGLGQFPLEILERKLLWCQRNSNPMGMLRALSSVYGVDIQKDSILECRKRMLELFYKYVPAPVDSFIEAAAPSIVEANFIVGDTINRPEDIVFLEYHEENFPFNVTENRLSDMVGEEYMKALEKRRKREAKKQAKKRD